MAVNKKMESKAANGPGSVPVIKYSLTEGKDLLQSVIDASLVAIAYLKPIRNNAGKLMDFECVFANKKAIEYTGAEMAGKRLSDLFPDIRDTMAFENYVKVIEENVTRDFEFYYKNEKFDHWFRVIAIKIDNGVAINAEDITQQKKAQKEVITHHNILKQTEELAQAGSWEYNIETKEFLWSEGMYRLFEIHKIAPLNPEVYLEFAVAEDMPVADKIVNAIQKTFLPFEETLTIAFNGSIKTLKVKGAPLSNDQGQIEKMLGVDVDCTAALQSEVKIMELNSSLTAMNKELRTVNDELKHFNSIAATNYGEALRQVYINLEMIVSTDARTLSDSSRANLRRTQSAIQKMKLLTSDISNYLQFYDLGIQKQMINPNSIIKNVLSAMKGKIEDAQAVIKRAELPSFTADPLLFSHLMTNLLDNAIKFRKLVVQPAIKIHCSHADELNVIPKALNDTGYVIIIVTDNGIGFQQEESDKMFELFYQLSTQGKNKGSGMGLAICKKIMEMHGGFIVAESTPAMGASFQCYFPL